MSIKQDFDKIKATIITVSPFISSLLRKARVILTKQIPTAGVSKNYTLAINPDFFNSLTFADKTWVCGHETIHLAFNHPRRQELVEQIYTFNIAADAVDNRLLRDFIKCTDAIEIFNITMYKIYETLRELDIEVNLNDLELMSVEEIYKLLLKIPTPPKITICLDLSGNGDGDGEEGEVLQEGDEEIYDKRPEERAEAWKRCVVKAYAQQKIAGNTPAGLKREVDRLLESKVDWRALLRQAFHNGYGRTIVATYSRPSRKHKDLPGIHRFTYPEVHCLVDTSGSIGDEELRQFISEIYDLARRSPVSVRCWDADAYEEIDAKNNREVINKVANKMTGGGGTVIQPCLKKTLERMRNRDIVVVLTDGEIFDLDESNILFSQVASKSSISVIASTYKTVEIPQWSFIKIEV